MADKQTVQNLDLGEIKENVRWENLIDIYKSTLDEITKQIALVYELKDKAKDRLDEETEAAFQGLILSFQDLLKETFETSLLHASKTTEVEKDGNKIKVPEELIAGPVESDDDALNYINIASKYFNIQDKVIFLISTGWVDLFVKLKLDTQELNKTLVTANKILEKTLEGDEDGKQQSVQ